MWGRERRRNNELCPQRGRERNRERAIGCIGVVGEREGGAMNFAQRGGREREQLVVYVWGRERRGNNELCPKRERKSNWGCIGVVGEREGGAMNFAQRGGERESNWWCMCGEEREGGIMNFAQRGRERAIGGV